MKKLAISALLIGVLAAPAYATTISVGYSEDFQEKLEEDYGLREGERISEFTTRALTREFEKRGIDVDRVEVTILDAKPNRPTFQQLSDEPSLDLGRSLSIGGAELSAKVFDADGNLITELEYDWFENDIRDAVGSATWTDARRATRFFATRVAKAVEQS